MSSGAPDDRTTRARIRDAAISCVAEHGVAATTARKVAEAAGVSPALVIHHFGSMEGLFSACNEYVAATIRRRKLDAVSAGPGLDVLSALRGMDDYAALAGYLAAVLAVDSPVLADLVDDLVADAEEYGRVAVEAGMMRPSAEPRRRAAALVLMSLGLFAVRGHVRRLLGVDVTHPAFGSDAASTDYVRTIYEILGEGIFTEEFARNVRENLSEGGVT